MNVNRRDLLKVIGLAAAGSALPGCEREVHNLIPYVLPDDEIVPGVANWYASLCQECGAGCGVMVRVMEGRAKKVEGNPLHPVNEGKLCAMGQASLQGLYNPDRIRAPLKRDGKRGEGKFKTITWDEGLALWDEQLRRHARKAAMISRPVPGTLGDLFTEFMAAVDGELIFYDPSDAVPIEAASQRTFGLQTLPHYDLANSDYVLSFGAPFLEHWLSPVAFGAAYGYMRQGRPSIRGRLVQVEPRMSLTAANADRWIPSRPGTEALVAMGIGQVILTERQNVLSSTSGKVFRDFFFSLSLIEIAKACDVSKELMVQVAHEFGTALAPLALAGGAATAHTNSTVTLMAVNALNAMVGNLGQPGGVQFFKPVHFPYSQSPQLSGERALIRLSENFRNGSRRMLHLYDSNPLFMLPPSLRFGDVFTQADFIVSFSAFPDESTNMADLILPDHTPLESWGDHRQSGLAPVPVATLAQPVVLPLYDSRMVGDVFLAAAHALGGETARLLPWRNFYEMLQERWKRFVVEKQRDVSFDLAWPQLLQQGGWWREQGTPLVVEQVNPPPPYEPPRFSGDLDAFPLYLYPYPSLAFDHGRGANRPWLQQLPDTLTTAMWGSWIEINPLTARDYALREGDIARVTSQFGSVEAPVVFFPGIRPDLIALPIGQGHQAYGRYAQNRGVNPAVLLGPLLDQRTGCLASGSTRVNIERSRGRSELVVLDPVRQGSLPDLREKGSL